MACTYCFYNDEGENRTTKSYGMMSTSTAHALIDKALHDGSDSASFGFQGGEPTLAGLDFLSDFVSYARSKAEARRIHFSLQTNGYAIDRQWAALFREHGFLIGLSLDGSKRYHDEYRLDKSGKGTYNRVFNNAKMLQREGVEFNILVTTTRQIARNVDELYDFFKRNGFRYLQFTPCIDPISSKRGSLDYSLTTETFSSFLIRLFRLYYRDWKRGQYTSIHELDKKRDEIGFIEKSRRVAEDCRTCRYYRLCRGGCRRDREDFATHELGKTYLCEAYRTFFDECLDGLMEIAEAEAAALRMHNAH